MRGTPLSDLGFLGFESFFPLGLPPFGFTASVASPPPFSDFSGAALRGRPLLWELALVRVFPSSGILRSGFLASARLRLLYSAAILSRLSTSMENSPRSLSASSGTPRTASY